MDYQSMDQFMAAIMALTGVMATYYAITGKGKVYENDYPKAMKDDANKMLRNFLWFVGPYVLVFGVLEIVGFQWAFWASMLILPAIVVYYVKFRKRFKQYLKK